MHIELRQEHTLKNGDLLRCSVMVKQSRTAGRSQSVTLVTNPMIDKSGFP